MTEEQKPQEPQRQEIHISFEPAPPKPHKAYRWGDGAWIIIAAGIVGTVFKSSVVFAIVAVVCIMLYLVGGGRAAPKP